MNVVKRSQRRPVDQGGYTLIELLIGAAIISIVAALAVPLYSPSAMRGATCA
jgi:prepilin-type N-terminal cleavage/methylation domain-containing protein